MITPPILWWSADLADRRRHDDEFATGVITEVDRLYFLATDAGWAALNELPADARRLVVDTTTGQAPADDTAAPADDSTERDPEQYRRGHLDGRALVTGLLPDVARYALDVETRRRDAACRELAYLDGRVAGCRVGLAAQSTPTTGDTETTDG